MTHELRDSDYVRNIGRNMVISLLVTYALTFGLCVLAIGEAGQAAAIAGIPTVFAGPYLGLLVTLTGAVRPAPGTSATTSRTADPAAEAA